MYPSRHMVEKLNDSWKKINKNKNKTSAAAKKSQNDYEGYLDSLFDIAAKDVESAIDNDRLRSLED